MTFTRISPRGGLRAVEVDGERQLELQIITYNISDDWGSVWLPGCLDEGLAERFPQLARNHDRSDIIGRAFKFSETGSGPKVTFYLDDFEDVPNARIAYSQVNRGTIDDCSIGFRRQYDWRPPTDEEKEKWPGVKEVISKAFVSEVSVLMEGAVPGAKVLAVRSLQPRRSRVISEDVGLSIVSAAIQAVQGGATATDAIKAALADIESNSVDQEDEPNEATEETEAKPVEETEAEQVEEITEPVVTEETAEIAEASVEQESTETNLTESTVEAETEQVEQVAEIEVQSESVDPGLEALFAEVDSLMADRDDPWVSSAIDVSSEGVTA